MRVSRLLSLFSVILLFTVFIIMPGSVWGDEHPWDENNASGGDPTGLTGDGGTGEPGSIDPNATDDPNDGDVDLMGTPFFWWELLFGDDGSGANSVQPVPTSISGDSGAVTPDGEVK
ncbi:MAG: hypothetical protein KAR42_05510 [candidate division Zixibacteria bacterium]|nr:hypothetical protein [candidate division Zixibacteria bacterium]